MSLAACPPFSLQRPRSSNLTLLFLQANPHKPKQWCSICGSNSASGSLCTCSISNCTAVPAMTNVRPYIARAARYVSNRRSVWPCPRCKVPFLQTPKQARVAQLQQEAAGDFSQTRPHFQCNDSNGLEPSGTCTERARNIGWSRCVCALAVEAFFVKMQRETAMWRC